MAALLAGAAIRAGGQSADDIARAIVIGQAYTSGNVYLGGFAGDDQRAWPKRVTLTALKTRQATPLTAGFTRALAPDSEELSYFPQREDGGSAGPDDLFSTIDSMAVTDANLALFRASGKIATALPIVGWDDRVQVIDISFAGRDQTRPTTAAERAAIDAEKNAIPKDFECTTEPRYLDSATVILTAKIAQTNTSIRLSQFATPGCAGHLSEIYVLDVLEPGRDPRRFEFRHYVGVL